jgi:hypothetical protein
MKVLVTFQKGDENCEHNFVFDNKMKLGFSYPITCTNFRICTRCGRYESVMDNSFIENGDGEEFNRIKDNFSIKEGNE